MRWRSSLCLLFVAAAVQAAYVVNNAGRKISGPQISADAEGSVTLATASGQKLTFRKGQYRAAAADRPKELDEAAKLLKAGRGEQAVPLLKKVKADCRFLEWDQQAILLLANHFFETEQYALAAAEFQALETRTPEVQARLRESMVQSGDTQAVLAELNEEIRTGDRAAAARAYLMRGELKAAQGDSSGARRDWLKVITFFKAENEAVLQAKMNLKEQ